MVSVIIDETTPITLVGGASFKKNLLKMALDRAPKSVGADGGGLSTPAAVQVARSPFLFPGSQ